MTDTPDSTCLMETPAVVAVDQRAWPRFQPERTEAFVVTDDERIAATIVDESFDGLGVLVPLGFQAEVNDPIELEYCGLPIRGLLRSVVHQGARTRLGIQWAQRHHKSLEMGRRRCRTESDYVRLAGLPVACRVVDQAGNDLIALLPDGSELEITPESLQTLNRFQRLDGLKGAEEELRFLLAVYQLGAVDSPDDALRQVLNLEFASKWD